MPEQAPHSPSVNVDHLRVGVDIGGTFTDFTVTSETGEVLLLWKEETTPGDLSAGVLAGMRSVAQSLGLHPNELLARADLLVHGTTAATNSVIERNGPRTGLLCTKGFRDVLYFRDGLKPERFNIHLQHPREFVDRYLRVGVDERLDRTGTVVRPLDEDDVRAAAAHFRAAGVEAVAVAFLWSMINPTHEQRAAEILRDELPGVYIVTSYDVMPEIREWERTSATALERLHPAGDRRVLAEARSRPPERRPEARRADHAGQRRLLARSTRSCAGRCTRCTRAPPRPRPPPAGLRATWAPKI